MGLPSMGDSGGIFAATLDALGAGLHVRHIAEFDLCTCLAEDDVSSVWSDGRSGAFDQIPVRGANNRLVGVLCRTDIGTSGKVRDHMLGLDDTLLISDTAPLYSFVQSAKNSHYRLVLTGDGITGIVAGSDLLKLSARLLAFSFVTHLESTMSRVIHTRYAAYDTGWLALLSSARQKKFLRKRSRCEARRLDPAPLELTEFCDKRQILARTFHVEQDFVQDMERIELLRNQIDHAAAFVSDDEGGIHAFVDQMEIARKWILSLERRVHRDEVGAQRAMRMMTIRVSDSTPIRDKLVLVTCATSSSVGHQFKSVYALAVILEQGSLKNVYIAALNCPERQRGANIARPTSAR